MRSLCLMFFLGLLAACASAPRIVATDSDMVAAVRDVARDLVGSDIVALGETHQTPGVHQTHHELLAAMHELRPNMVIAMEMFERDVQNVLLQYLNGVIDEAAFLRESRPWPHYERDYRPVIEFAKKNGLIVLAANAPRPLAQKAAKEGVEAVMPNPNLASETTAPEDAYWDAFCEAMEGHEGMFGEGGMQRYYAAQCLKDDTMAESITAYLQERNAVADRPLVVLICGRMHSDYGRGTVQRIKNRMPNLRARVLSAETLADMDSAIYEASRELADYVVIAPQPERAAPPVVAVQAKKPTAAESGEHGDDLPTENPEGLRAAFGFMPNYAGEDAGVEVGPVREGGPAEKAGIEEGDIIVAVKGIPTPDVETYSELLEELIIGRTVTVRVRRESAEVDLQVKVGSRQAR